VKSVHSVVFSLWIVIYRDIHVPVNRSTFRSYKSGLHLGNMWAQEWMNIDDVLTPFPEVTSDDVTSAMVAQNYTPLRMFRLAEEFFTSIGLEPMTEKFWNLSMIVRPKDRPVECHGAAEDLMTKDDFR